MPCNPPLQFVPNGAPGSALPPALDPNDVPKLTPSPTFTETACTFLGSDLCSAMDPISAIDELPALADAVDALTTAADASLDAILLELDNLGHQEVSDNFDTFSGGAPAEQGLLDTGAVLSLPAEGTIPLLLPNGSSSITFGGDPAYGGTAAAGGAPYDLHLALPGVHAANIDSLEIESIDGPNPPFTGAVGVALDTSQPGQVNVATVGIDPAAAGTYTATLKYSVQLTITGISGRAHLQKIFQVVIQ